MNIESLLCNENFHFGHYPRKYPRVPRWISGFLTIFPNDRVWTPGRIKKESLSSLLAVALVVGLVARVTKNRGGKALKM